MSTGIATTRAHERDAALVEQVLWDIDGWFTPMDAALISGAKSNYPALSRILRTNSALFEKRANPNDGRSVQYRWRTWDDQVLR